LIEFIKYSIAGLINAATGYGVFFAMIKLTDFSPEIANAVCYIVSIFFAFLLNRFFVFKGSKISKHTILRYISAFTSAFIINQVVFFILFRIFFLKPEMVNANNFSGFKNWIET